MPRITAMPTHIVRALQAGGTDANGQAPEQAISTGPGNPCRHCLAHVPDGDPMLILSHRPFPTLHPYAESGPIFLCAKACDRFEEDAIPEILRSSPDYLVKGYDATDRIIYGTGAVVAAHRIMAYSDQLLARSDVSYVHIRSSRNNCYQARVDRDNINQLTPRMDPTGASGGGI
ncbi:DUF1203 domain-containing protein [Aliisedimentitalea scapharcae]|uniref:DUF1203 domain-containing protein n=1 Tax=Aliisedimentitalea scapharcae TaxID=1524259 RepID=A0ABZ2XRM5_9RHOB